MISSIVACSRFDLATIKAPQVNKQNGLPIQPASFQCLRVYHQDWGAAMLPEAATTIGDDPAKVFRQKGSFGDHVQTGGGLKTQMQSRLEK